jgi:predicted metal-dependent TIM-barrel fold hydrolase
MVKTSDKPSFYSSNCSPFTSSDALRSSDISPVPSLNLKLNPRGVTAKKIMSSPSKNILKQLSKRKQAGH